MTQKIAAIILTVVVTSTAFLTGCITTISPTTTTTTTTFDPSPTTTSETASATATTSTVQSIDTTWTADVSDGTQEDLPSIADVVALVKPSVVAINTEMYVDSFFGQYEEEGAGSGWILDDSGVIVTNYHVIEDANSITVTLDDGRVFPVQNEYVFTDDINDLAILKIDAENLPALTIGDSSQLRIGDWVVAIGNSLGRGTRATVGIVSQLEVALEFEAGLTLYNLIDTSAVINPGNSGGPLVNLAGEVIGITSAKIIQSGAEATGFAISTEEAAPIIEELVNNGYVVRPYLGVQGLITVDQSVASYYRLPINYGVLVRGVMDDSPADDAGLETGDIITSLDGEEITTLSELLRILYASDIGEPLEITYYRNRQETTTEIYPIETPPPSYN